MRITGYQTALHPDKPGGGGHREEAPVLFGWASLFVILVAALTTNSAHAQFGPARVVVAEVVQRPVAPVQTFVASVAPLRKSVVGTAVNGRVEEFLPHSMLAYGSSLGEADGAMSGYQVRLAYVPNVVGRGESEDAALDDVAQKLQALVDQAKQGGQEIAWTDKPSPPAAGEQEHWVVYRPGESKLIQVKRRQPLALLRTGTVKIHIDVAVAQRDLREAEYEEAVQIQDGLVAQAEAKLAAAQATKEFTASQYARNKQLYDQNRSVSLQQLQQAESDAAVANQQYIEAQVTALHVQRGDRIVQAKARLDEATAMLHELQDRLEKYTIRAPFDGFVVAEHTEVGAWVREGDAIADVVQLQPVEVRAFVSEQYVSQLQIGGKAIVRPRVPLPEGQAVPIGRITGVIAEAVTRSRTFPVRIEVDNPDHLLKAGMLAEVELEVGPQTMSTMVPKDALYIDRRYPLPQVFLAVPDEKDPKKTKPLQIAVKQGASLGRWIVVEPVGGTIEPGDLVVEKGNERITAATKELIPITEGATPPPKK